MEQRKEESMEFGVAAFGALAAVVISKLCVVMETKLRKNKNIRADVLFVKDDLEAIKDVIQRPARYRVHAVFIVQLRRLAYDIEDRVDCFDAQKMTLVDFGNKIVELKRRSIDLTERIKRFTFPAEGDDRTSQGHEATVVPVQLQNLGDYNLNCLLYLCLFPPNHPVRTKPLIRRWLAEGLVLGEKDAVKNLKIFTNPGILNSIERSNNGEVRRCQPTEEIFQYISRQSVLDDFISFCDGTAQPLQHEVARRLSVYPHANGELNLPRDLSLLRTLAVFPTAAGGGAPAAVASSSDEAVLDFSRYGVLRVLDLKERGPLSEDHLKAIWGQVLMKYLSINLGTVTWIERKIGNLDQLETLDLSGGETVMVFKEVLQLPKLKHLFGKFQLTSTTMLAWKLKRFLAEKSQLETLAGFVTDGTTGFPQLMTCMKMLRKVKIWCISKAGKENLGDISSAIWKFSRDGTADPARGRSLTIDLQGCSGQFLNTAQPRYGKGILASLKLCGQLSKFPEFVAQLSLIKELCLCSTGLSWQNIRNGLTKVNGLKYLKIIDDNLGVFVQALDIPIQANPLPDLMSLHILCHNLAHIPGTPGIEIAHMKNLKEVALHHLIATGIQDEWKKAVDNHPYEPVPRLLSIQVP